MTVKSGKQRFGNSGQAIVELAIILLPLALLIFGMIEFGRYLYLKNSVTNAAREGVRKAVVTNPWDNSSNGSALTIITYTKTLPSMDDTSVSVMSSPSPPSTGAEVSVTVRKPFATGFIDLIPQFKNMTSIRATATMRYE